MTDNDIFEIQDDLNVTEDSYPQQETGFRPPLPGTYNVKPTTWGMRKDKQGNLVLWKNSNGEKTYPVIGLTTVEITEPLEYGRKVVLFQDVPTVPFEREGRKASRAADLLRAIDVEATAANTGDVIRQLSDGLNAGMEFKARLDYEAYDPDYAKQLIEQAGGKDNIEKKELNKLYDRAKIRGYNKIRKSNMQDERGQKLPLHKWLGPSGNVIEARPVLTAFYPSNEEVTLGPDKGALS